MDHINGFKAAVAAVLGCLTALWGWFGWLVVAWVACMLLDYATGTAAALKAGKWSCKAAREGLWHKLGSIVENAGRLGAPLPAWLSKAIAALESGVDSAGDKLTQGEQKE